MKQTEPLTSYQKRIQKAYLLLCCHLDKPLDINLLAKEAAFSPFHFHRIYRYMLGETVAETHRRLRLERAAGLLIQKNLSITHIALDSGYETLPAFSRAFKAHFSLTPSQYRKNNQRNRSIQHRQENIEFHYVPIIKENIMQNIKIEERPITPALVLAHTGPYNEIGPIFNQLWQWIISNNLVEKCLYGFAIYYDDPTLTTAEKCRADAGVVICGQIATLPDYIRKIELPAGRYARYRFIGPYSNLEQAYSVFFGQWLPTSGYEFDDFPPFEVYINDPHNTPEHELITDIYIKIK